MHHDQIYAIDIIYPPFGYSTCVNGLRNGILQYDLTCTPIVCSQTCWICLIDVITSNGNDDVENKEFMQCYYNHIDQYVGTNEIKWWAHTTTSYHSHVVHCKKGNHPWNREGAWGGLTGADCEWMHTQPLSWDWGR